MPISILRRSTAAIPFVAVGLLLAACSAPGDGKDPANDAAAVKFTACLNAAGQTAKIVDGGQVGLLMPEQPGTTLNSTGSLSMGEAGGGGEPVMLSVFQDADGQWLSSNAAEGYPEEGGMREAWAGCEEEVPEFEQPVPEMPDDAVMMDREDIMASSLAFASCARENGYSAFPDPDKDGQLELPFGITEDELRSLMEACYDEESGIGPMFSMKSVESADFDVWAVLGEFMGGMIAIPAMPTTP